jgi:hypothetical protein
LEALCSPFYKSFSKGDFAALVTSWLQNSETTITKWRATGFMQSAPLAAGIAGLF